MKKRWIAFILTAVMVVGLLPAMTLPAAAAAAPTKMWVAPTEANGLPAQIDVFVSATSTTGYGTNKITTYTCGLYLPGNVDTSNCFLSWDNSMQVTVDGTTYESGTCPVPSPGSTITYDFTGGSPKNKFVVTKIYIILS